MACGAPSSFMSKALKLYFIGIASAALAFGATLNWSDLANLSQADWIGLGTFLFLAILSQALAVESTVGASKPIKSSIAFLPLMALAVVMPVPAVVLAIGTMTAGNEFFFVRERSIPRAVFNTSQTVLSFGLGATVFRALADLSGIPPTVTGAVGIGNLFLPFYGLAVTFFVLNLVFVSTVIALREGERLSDILTEAAGRGGGNLFYDLLASPIALFAAYLYESFYVGGLLAIILPLLLIRHSYLSAIQLEQANRDLLRVLIKAIETRDPYTSGHSRRVSTLARMIAKDHGLRSSMITHVETAALLHDIGKIDALYADIISKPSALTDEERQVIRTHATKGADLLQTLTSLDTETIVGVRHHHEQFDGSGYPGGLRGKGIPMAARIIMISDSVDAMLSDRPYRNALPLTEVRKELQRCSGSQFDPDLIKTIMQHGTLERAELLIDRSGTRTPARIAIG